MDIEINILILIALITLVASFIQSLTGFGFGIIAMIFLPNLLRFTEANVLSSILSTATSLIAIFTVFKKINWKNLLFPILGSIFSNYFAISFVKTAPSKTLTLLLGVALFVLSLYFFFFSDKIKIRATWYSGLIAGTISGVMSGLFSIGGPPVVVYFLQSEKDTETYLATISTYFVLSGIIAISMKVASGFITQNVFVALLISIVTMSVGSLFGKHIRDKTNKNLIKKCVYGLMSVSGLVNVIMFFM